ncbi:hypothetical protein FRB90_001361, partial [Tulasnella sp. 427]
HRRSHRISNKLKDPKVLARTHTVHHLLPLGFETSPQQGRNHREFPIPPYPQPIRNTFRALM